MRWRSWWDFGTNGLGDWGCHVLDVIFFAYDELLSPVSVKTDCPEPAGKVFHVNPCKSTVTYQVSSDKFAGKTFPDPLLRLQPAADAGADADSRADQGQQHDGGRLRRRHARRWKPTAASRSGAMARWRKACACPACRKSGEPLNHWHAWVDNCLGKKTELRTPFKDAVRITEAALLAVKATPFPRPGTALGQVQTRLHQQRGSHQDHRPPPIPRGLRAAAVRLENPLADSLPMFPQSD